MLELQVAMGVLAIGLLGLGTLMVRQGRQVGQQEKWCVPDRTVHVVTQADPWMRALGDPADFSETPGQDAWSPPVPGNRKYDVWLLSHTKASGSAGMSAQVSVEDPEKKGGGDKDKKGKKGKGP